MDRIELNDYILKMISGTELPESKQNEKKEWVKTGVKLQAYQYIFVKNDITKNKIVITSVKDFGLKEGEQVKMLFSVGYNDFTRKNIFKFEQVSRV